MDTLSYPTSKKYFNTLMSFDDIVLAYANNEFPDSYCVMCTKYEYEKGITSVSNENNL